MKKKHPWIKVFGFGGLAAAAVGAFLFNLSMIHKEYNMGGMQAINNSIYLSVAALLCIALFVWSILSARKESMEPEDLSAPSAQEEWEAAHPILTDGSLKVEQKKEKHSAGYWVKEFMRLAGIPVLLFVLIWFGVYYLILEPIVENL